jgi:hypothetical protein
MNEKLINFIVVQLKEYTEDKPIEYMRDKRDNWLSDKTLKKCTFIKNEFNNFDKLSKDLCFDRDIHLKFCVNNVYKNQIELDKWIIQDWGGISTHKNFDTLNKSKDERKFDRISSWSKLLSFENIEDDIIYDSRVIYSINWIIYKFNKHYNCQEKYLFQPNSRNGKLSLLSVNSIIYLDNDSSSGKDKIDTKKYNHLFINKNECYNYAKDLIKSINQLLFQDIKINILDNNIELAKYSFFTEMLLFEIADKEIFCDIKQSISVNIK